MTTQALLGIIPPVVAAGAVLMIANSVFSPKKAQKAWPTKRIRTYRIKWQRNSTKGTRIVYGPNMATATEGFEDKYPKREVIDIEEA